MAAFGATQADQFERLISKSHRSIHLSSGQWPRYLRGDVMPQGSLEKHKANLVERLNEIHKGTSEIFYHPIWPLFDFDRLLGPRQLKDLYTEMSPSVWENFVQFSTAKDGTITPKKSPFWKPYMSPEDLEMELAAIKGLDGVAACLIESRMAYLGQFDDDCVNAVLGAYTHLHSLTQASEFQFPKAQSVLLVLKAMLLRFASCLIADSQYEKYGAQKLCEIFEFRQTEWKRHAEAHQRTLSMPAAMLFTKWTRQARACTYAW